MGVSTISLGLGLGGGKAATSSGRSGGGGGGGFASTLSASFDGTDAFLLMGTSAISLDTNFTISAWIKPTSAALAGYDFIGGWGNAASGQTRAMQILNSKLSFEIFFSRVSGSTDLLADTWHHAAITFSGNNVEIFLNGSSDGTGSLSRSTMTASETFIGGTSTMTSEGFVPFAGLIDEFAVFDSVLSASNISAIYNSGVPADLTSYSPVGWWRMGENDSGSNGATIGTVTDQGSGGNNGTGTNGPTYSNSVPTWTSTLSADLDGSNMYLDIGSSGDMGSFSLWFKSDSTITTSTTGQYLLSFTANSNVFGNLGLGSTTGMGGLATEVLTFNQGNRAYAYEGSGVTINTDWHHVAGRWTGSTYEIYLDGNQVKNAEVGSGTAGQVAFSALKIGGRGAAQNYAGLIDEVAVFTNPLSAVEIVAIYNSGVPADLSSYSPLGWWRMGENDSGSNGATIGTVTDQGSGGNNATGTNSPTYSNSVPS